MNSEKQLKSRQLSLLPVRILKELLDSKEKEDAIEVLSQKSLQFVDSVCFANQGYCRQTIHLYSYEKRISNLPDFPFTIIQETTHEGTRTVCIKHEVSFRITLHNPLHEEVVKFYQPIILRFRPNKIISIEIVKLEKNISSLFDPDREPSGTTKLRDENTLLEELLFYFNSKGNTLTPLDINQGVKKIWDEDFVDCAKVRYRRNRSIAQETMDENQLFKQSYPQEYNNLISRPLDKTVFKYLKNDDKMSEIMDIEPMIGILSFNRFAKNPNQHENVISQILQYNQ